MMLSLCWIQSHSKCLADVCGALHCDLMMDIPHKTKCNPAAAARKHHLCEVAFQWCPCIIIPTFYIFIICHFVQSLANSCFPVNEGPSASRLHGSLLYVFFSHNYKMLQQIIRNLLISSCDFWILIQQNSSCVNSAMPTLAREIRNPSLVVAG